MKRLLLSLLTLLSVTLCFARPQTRAVIIDTVCNASLSEMKQVVDSFCRQFQACPDSLFLWAYLGLGEDEIAASATKESKDAIQLRYKDRVYDPVLKTGDVAIDVYVLGVRWWKDQHLGTKYLESHTDAPYSLTQHLTATYSGSILEGGDIVLLLTPLSEQRTRVQYEFRLTFGRFLSAFISDKTWRNAIEWRFEAILENLVECAETGTVQDKIRGPKS